MKNLRQAYIDHLSSGTLRLTVCMRIVRRDGTTFRFTDHDRELTMQDTGAVYQPQDSASADSAVTYNADGSPDKIDLMGALVPNGVSRDDIQGGLFDFAEVFIFRTIWDDPMEDDEELMKGRFGTTELEDNRFVTDFTSLASALDQEIGRVHSPVCDANLGDNLCQVRLTPPTWSASTAYNERTDGDAGSGSVVAPSTENGTHQKCITAGTSGSSEPTWNTAIGGTTTDGTVTWEAIRARTQTDTVGAVTGKGVFTGQISFPDDWFGGGTVKFTSGANSGIEREVKSYVSGQYTLWAAMPFDVSVGDTFVATAGCRKRFDQDCQQKFENRFNFQGYPHLPGENAVNKFGGQ